jgi:bifunctional non-homologous end joining protein LigD
MRPGRRTVICPPGKHNDEVQLLAFNVLAMDGDDLRKLPLTMRKTNLARLLARRPDGIFVAPYETGEIDRICSVPPVGWDSKVSSASTAIAPIAEAPVRIGSRSRTATARQ